VSDVYEGPGWTKASDGKWYPPEQEPTSTGGEEARHEAPRDSQVPTGQGTSPDNLVQPVDVPVATLGADGTAMQAAWYPDPVDSASFRYWDGVAWTRSTKLVPPPTPMPVDEVLSAPSDEAGPFLSPYVAPSEKPPTDNQTDGAEHKADGATGEYEDTVDHWVREADKAIATAETAGTPEAWRSAAQAAVVVAEIAQTMRVTTHAHQIAEQLAQAAEEAAHEAQTAKQAADDAMRTAERTAQAAEEAATGAQIAVEMARNSRQRADQMVQAIPKAVESARFAAQEAANAKARTDHLDQIVIKAQEANTPEAWSEALQIATEVYGDPDRIHIVSARPKE